MTRDANDKRILVPIRGGNLRNKYMYLTAKPGFFPRESYGASNRKKGLGRALTLVVKGLAEPVETDLSPRGKDDTSRCFFRPQKWLRRFFTERGVHEGNKIAFERTSRLPHRIHPVKDALQTPPAPRPKPKPDTLGPLLHGCSNDTQPAATCR